MQKILTKEGLVVYNKDAPYTVRFNQAETDKMFNKKIDYSELDYHCEIVHLEISNQCNLSCPYCYNDKRHTELTTENWKKHLSDLADYGVFQVTFGGGEPLLREDWRELVQYAVNIGLNVGLTTNGILLPTIRGNEIKLFKQINVSYHGDLKVLKDAIEYLHINLIPSGINFVMRKEYLPAIKNIMDLAKNYDSEVLLLTYKAVKEDKEQTIEPREVYEYAETYNKIGVRVAVDGLTCYGQKQDFCLQKKTFCDIDSMGNVYPCSFIRKSIGNIVLKDFKTIWRERGEQEKCPFLK